MPITPDQYSYPFDPTGTAPSNKVTGEVHVITQQNYKDYSFVIPKFAPFFEEGVMITFADTEGNQVTLTQGVDYYFGHHFLAASRAIGKQVYGSISFITKNFKGSMSISYQTLGGMWTYDEAYLVQLMSNIVANPRSASWDSIVTLPTLFPVIDHEWNLQDMVGMSHVVSSLYGIQQAILDPTGQSGSGVSGLLMDHLQDAANPHRVTKLQVGLGNVLNYGVAAQADAESGVADNMYMTPILTKQAITYQVGNKLNQHQADKANPHEVTKAQVGLGSVQDFGIASTTDAQAGTSNELYMTPLRVKEAISIFANVPISDHVSNRANPHSVTAVQVGLGNVQNYNIATTVEAQAGLSNTSYMTPARVKEAIAALANGSIDAHLADHSNPHLVTAVQVGLGNVMDYGIADQTESELGISNMKYMTPQTTKYAIAALALAPLNIHVSDSNNPHNVTKSQVGLGNVGNYGLALQVDAETGTSNVLYMTPLSVKQAITYQAVNPLNAHLVDKTNPHVVTALQVGLGNVDNYKTATTVEAIAGTATDRFMTPAGVRAAIADVNGGDVAGHLTNYNNPHNTTATQVGAYTTTQTDDLLAQKVGINDTAANSNKLANMSVAELTLQILSNKIASAGNADTLGGNTYNDIITAINNATVANSLHLENKTVFDILQDAAAQTSANSVKLGGMTLQDLLDAIPSTAEVARQVIYDALPVITGAVDTYTDLFYLVDPAAEDAIVIVSGAGVETTGTKSYSYLVKLDHRTMTVSAVNLTGDDSSIQFGVNAFNNSGTLEFHVWMKGLPQRGQVSLTELSGNIIGYPDVTNRTYKSATVPSNVVVDTDAPLSITWAVEQNTYKLINTHAARTDNPHGTTKAQVGLGNVDNYQTASNSEGQTGTATNRFMTPATTMAAITSITTPLTTRVTTLESEVSQILTDLTTHFNGLTV